MTQQVQNQIILSWRQRCVKDVIALAKQQYSAHHDPATRGSDGSSGSTYSVLPVSWESGIQDGSVTGKAFYAVGVRGEAFDGNLELADLVEFWVVHGMNDAGDFARSVAVGTWYDPEADITYIDLVVLLDKNTPDYPVLEQALDLGRANGQQTICDLETLEIIKC